MASSLYFNRRRNFRIFESSRGRSPTRSYLPHNNSQGSSPDGYNDSDSFSSDSDPLGSSKYTPKKRNLCGLVVQTPNSSRFANNWHSRVLAKWPFLIEMFYWVLNLAFYSLTKAVAQVLFSTDDGLLQLAEDHGVLILDIEHKSWLSFLFPIQEADFQAWFLNGHLTAITFLNRFYSLVHIPGTVTYVVPPNLSPPTPLTNLIDSCHGTITPLLTTQLLPLSAEQ